MWNEVIGAGGRKIKVFTDKGNVGVTSLESLRYSASGTRSSKEVAQVSKSWHSSLSSHLLLVIPGGKNGGPRTSGAGRRAQGPEAHTHIHAQDTECHIASIQELGEAVREEGDGTEMGMELRCLSNSYRWVTRAGGSWIGVCQEDCVPTLEKQHHASLTGFLPVAGARHLRWCLDEGRRSSSVICKQMEVGDMLSGCSQAGHPASLHLIKESRLEFP